jgi:hypothetical protein
MNKTLRNILVTIAGCIIGSFVNGGIINISGSIIPPPDGVDTQTMEGLQASMHLFEPKHFLFPFLAHALGTLVGAFIAAKFVTANPLRPAMIISGLFFMGGLYMVTQLPSPVWFSIVDLVGAYFPMGYLAVRLANRPTDSKTD